MKLIYDVAPDDLVIEQEMNEGVGTKKYIIKGIFSSPGVKNKNGRVYPKSIWEREVKDYQNVLKSGSSNSLLELSHPARQNVDMMEAVAKMTKLYVENGYVMGEAVLLDNAKANQLKTLIDNGIKMSVSSRGVGTVKNGLVEDFKLITFDVIPNQQQSDINASMMGIVEGVLESKEFILNEATGLIDEVEMCTENVCTMFKKEDIQEATKQKFAKFFEDLTSNIEANIKAPKEVVVPDDKDLDDNGEKPVEEKPVIIKTAKAWMDTNDKTAKEAAKKFGLKVSDLEPKTTGKDEPEEVREGMKVNKQAIIDELDGLTPTQLAKVFTFILSFP